MTEKRGTKKNEPLTVTLCVHCVLSTLSFSLSLSLSRYQALVGMDAIPHKTFWLELPALAKDGAIYSKDCTLALYNKTRAAYTALR